MDEIRNSGRMEQEVEIAANEAEVEKYEAPHTEVIKIEAENEILVGDFSVSFKHDKSVTG